MKADEIRNRIQTLEEELSSLPVGSYVIKVIKGKEQPYLQWSEGGKTKSRYIKKDEREDVMKQLARRAAIHEELKRLKKELASVPPISAFSSYHTCVVAGAELDAMVKSISGLQKRDCFSSLQKYIHGSSYGKVCLLYGLRRTGKTTLLLQAIAEMSPEERAAAMYMKARVSDTMADMNQDLKRLDSEGYRYFFINEVTLMEDFIDSASLFSDVYAMMGRQVCFPGRIPWASGSR